MNPATREQKKNIVKILNDADVDPTAGNRAILSPFLRDADNTFQRLLSRHPRCMFLLLPISCAKISRSPRKTLTSKPRVLSLAR